MKENTIIVFTDGSSRGNPGPGGWGAVVIEASGKVVELGGREDMTTNNRMEIAAALGALAHIHTRGIAGDIEINTDSAYLLQGITMWVYGWEKNGWKTKTGDDVLNQDLWKRTLRAHFPPQAEALDTLEQGRRAHRPARQRACRSHRHQRRRQDAAAPVCRPARLV